jgi:L-asparaginase II
LILPDARACNDADVPDPVLVEVVRGDVVESVHRGSVVIIDSDGSILDSIGDPGAIILPRSAVKHAQAVASLECGADVSGRLLALAASSHSGEFFHVQGVEVILASVGLTADDLGCPPDLPMDPAALKTWLASGRSEERIVMNCSGKHATMLAACVASGWPTTTYLDPSHPLQLHVRSVIDRLAGERTTDPQVDGCGAPLFGLSLLGLARLESAVVLAADGTPERAVADAVRSHPTYASGTNRDVARLMAAVPGFISKEGAEGVHVGALADGRALAFKIEDGSMRGRTPIIMTILRALGVDAARLNGLADLEFPPVFGGGAPVGELRASDELRHLLTH